MKKLLIILLGVILFTSCDKPTLENSVDDPESFTTVEIQKLEKDTVIVSFTEDGDIYFFNENNLVVYRASLTNSNTVHTPFEIFLILMVIGFLLGILLGVLLATS